MSSIRFNRLIFPPLLFLSLLITYTPFSVFNTPSVPTASADITTGLVGHWQFEGNTQDASGQGNHGTAQGGPMYTSGQLGQAISFDGVDDYLTLSTNPPSGPVTFTGWINIRGGGSGVRSIVGRLSYWSEAYGYGMYINDSGSLVGIAANNNGNWSSNLTSSVLPAEKWVHVAFTLDQWGVGTTGKIYVNGALVNSYTDTADAFNYQPRIGVGADCCTSGQLFDGTIDDVRIYNRALTQSDITELYALGSGPDLTPPVRSNGAPTGTLPQGTTQTTLSLTTNEIASCKYSQTAGQSYASMPSTFTTTGGTTHQQLITGLSDGQSYTYYVRCQDLDNNPNTTDSPISFSVAAPDVTSPSQPQSPSATAFSQSQINLSWIASTDNQGVTNYRIRRCQGSGCTPSTVISTLGNVTTYQNTGLSSNTLYRYTITALDAAGNESTQSTITQATTLAPDTTPPSTPTLNIPSVISSAQINLSWTASSDASGIANYELYRCQGTSCTPTTLIASPTGTTYNNTGLTANTTYRYRVRAVDVVGNPSNYSSIQNGTTPIATAGEWYVATTGTNNSSCGSSSAPCATAQYVVDQRASTGDVVKIQPGSYTGGIILSGSDPDGLTITAADTTNRPLINGSITIDDGVTNTTISYLRVDGGPRGDYYAGVVNVSEYPTTIDNMEIFNGGQGVMIRTSQQVTVSNSEIYDLGLSNSGYDTMCVLIVNWQNDPIPSGYANAIRLTGNKLHDCGGDGMQENSYSEAGVQFNYLIIDNNEIYNNQEQALDYKGTDDVRAYNNNMYGNGYGAISNNSAYGSTLRHEYYNNRIHDHTNFAIFDQGGGSQWKIYNNLIYNNVTNPQYNYCAVQPPTDSGTTFYNNTVAYNTDTSGTNQTCGFLGNGNQVRNNIFYNNGTGGNDRGQIYAEAGGTPSYNYVYPATCGTGQCTTGTNAITSSNPGLSDPLNGVFTLLSSSVNVDSGTILSAPYTVDILGTARPKGIAFDRGAYEYSSGGTDNTPPTISLTTPANGATISETIVVSANASDNVGVAGIQFLLDGANLGAEDTTSPYSINWNTTTVANGSYVLTARARDAAGNMSTSNPVTITVSNSSLPIVGDLNNDGNVNSIDWGLMNGVWFTNDATADLNSDGIVNSIDFGLMNSNWTG